jgi:hypothetical protein
MRLLLIRDKGQKGLAFTLVVGSDMPFRYHPQLPHRLSIQNQGAAQ